MHSEHSSQHALEPCSLVCLSYDEDNRRCIFSRHTKYISNHAWTFSEILLNEFTTNYANERGSSMMSNSLSHHGLT